MNLFENWTDSNSELEESTQEWHMELLSYDISEFEKDLTKLESAIKQQFKDYKFASTERKETYDFYSISDKRKRLNQCVKRLIHVMKFLKSKELNSIPDNLKKYVYYPPTFEKYFQLPLDVKLFFFTYSKGRPLSVKHTEDKESLSFKELEKTGFISKEVFSKATLPPNTRLHLFLSKWWNERCKENEQLSTMHDKWEGESSYSRWKLKKSLEEERQQSLGDSAKDQTAGSLMCELWTKKPYIYRLRIK